MHPINLLRIPASRYCLWSASREMAPRCHASHRNFTTQANSPASKTDGVRQRFLTIPHRDLHPDLKSPAEHIKIQNAARMGGALLYPLMSVVGPPAAILWTPVCVGVHHTSLRFAYRAALEVLKTGDVAADPTLNHELKAKVIAQNLSRFHFNYKGDLVLHMEEPAAFSLSKFKGISLLKDRESNPVSSKVKAIRDRIFPHFKSEISYFHLAEDIQTQVQKIIIARQLRFRACMGTVLAASTLGVSHDILGNYSITFPMYITLGIVTQSGNLSNFRVAKHTNALWGLIRGKSEFRDVIKPKYRELYQQRDFNKDMCLTVSTFGNIQYYDRYPLSFRQKYILKQRLGVDH